MDVPRGNQVPGGSGLAGPVAGQHNFDELHRHLMDAEGSDLHLRVGAPPLIRVHGRLEPIVGYDPLDEEAIDAMLRHILRDPTRLARLEEDGALDFSFGITGGGRMRANAFMQRDTIAIACRPIPDVIPGFEELRLPPVIEEIADEERGLILVTGTTGSGKSTTLAAIIDWINRRKAKNIITVEDPIEFTHRDLESSVAQREVGRDTPSFNDALRYVLRQDPDVILIGEMRDQETVRTAMAAAETGHLVLSTLHTVDAAETVNRIVDLFPDRMQRQARTMLAATLRAIVSQRLIPTQDGEGRVPACEVLRSTARVQAMILNSEETIALPTAITEGAYYGMQSFDQALYTLVKQGDISLDTALTAASHPHDLKLLLAAEGERSTSVQWVMDEGGRPR